MQNLDFKNSKAGYKFLYFTVLFLLFQTTLFAQENLFGGIEIGSKGIKMSVLDVYNLKKGAFTVKSFWAENVGIAKGISIDGNLSKEDIDKAAKVVLTNYAKLKNEFKITEENIFVVGSSGVAMAKNTAELSARVKELTQKNIEYIDASMEGKMLLKGCIPPSEYGNSIVLDIGGGNTKGGYVDVYNSENFVFFPLSLNYGTITLTETINKKVNNSTDISEYRTKSFGFLPTLREQVNAMYATKPAALGKERVYMSGGAVWAFYTLYKGLAQENFSEFKLEDVIYYDAVLKNNFQKFEDMAKKDSEIDKVLKTYSQKHLISGSNILQVCLEAIPGITDKRLFFAKEGHMAWLISYIVDRSKKIKKIY